MSRADLQALGLGSEATAADVKRRYRELAGRHHPDKGGDAAAFERIAAAYQRLKKRRCPACEGSGKLVRQRGFRVDRATCTNCRGRGA